LEEDGFVYSAPAQVAAAPVAAAPVHTAVAVAKPTAVASKPAGTGKEVTSQVSGVVVAVDVAVGDQVTEGQRLVTVEAMKMNTYVMAPFAGKVAEVLVTKGKSVLTGEVLVRLS
jgi:biotin carboxyl carrier protein